MRNENYFCLCHFPKRSFVVPVILTNILIISSLKQKIMAKKEKEKKLNAKQLAYEKKQEEKGKKVVAWIIGCFIALAVFYLLFIATNF